MKKISLLVLIFCVFLLTACGGKSKDVKGINDFEAACTNLDFTVNDNKVNYPEEYIIDTKIATLNDIEIQMFVYSDSEYATKVQNGNIESFLQLKSTGNIITKDKGKNYYKYTMI